MATQRLSTFERMLNALQPRSNTGCWEWQGDLTHNGYGRVKVDGKAKRVHRVMWELRHGPIPDGMVVMHKCDNPKCCNPEHLELGTQRENVADMIQKNRAVWLRSKEA